MATIRTRGISEFKSKLSGGGARPNLFEVQVDFPAGISLNIQGDGSGSFDQERFRLLCNAAALPASYVAPRDVIPNSILLSRKNWHFFSLINSIYKTNLIFNHGKIIWVFN
jgi:hypothetical protein